MGNVIDMTGLLFGKLVVVRRDGNAPNGAAAWLCRCECGRERPIPGIELRSGRRKSCGCATRVGPRRAEGPTRSSVEYKIWCGMIRRCCGDTAAWHRYGGRGIAICDRWRHDFGAFLSDMGPRPSPEHSIDRIDNDRGYEPGNCRWATRTEQANNTRSNRRLTFGGRSLTLAQWSRECGVPPSALAKRLRSGRAVDAAFFRPARKWTPTADALPSLDPCPAATARAFGRASQTSVRNYRVGAHADRALLFTPDESAEFARRLRAAAERRGLAQSDLAKACDAAPSVVNVYFSGKAVPRARRLASLAAALGCSADWLAAASDDPAWVDAKGGEQ